MPKKMNQNKRKTMPVSIRVDLEVYEYYKEQANVLGVTITTAMNIVLKSGTSWFKPGILLDSSSLTNLIQKK